MYNAKLEALAVELPMPRLEDEGRCPHCRQPLTLADAIYEAGYYELTCVVVCPKCSKWSSHHAETLAK